MTDWVLAIPLEEWPQQHPIDHQLRPAMTNDTWHSLRDISEEIVKGLRKILGKPKITTQMLSIVMPQHHIDPHKDEMGEDWLYRVHVPLTTNDRAVFVINDKIYRMQVGSAYKVNISRKHMVVNNGTTPRIHFMFDCYTP